MRAWVEKEQGEQKHTDGKEHTEELGRTRTYTKGRSKNQSSVSVNEGPCPSITAPVLVANAALSLLNVCCYLLDRQIEAQAKAFEKKSGFTERLYRVRSAKRKS